MAPGIFFSTQGNSVCDLAMSMKYTEVRLISNIIATFVHVILITGFLSFLDLGFKGVAIATSIHFVVRFIVALIYVNSITELKGLDVSFFSSETFENLGF